MPETTQSTDSQQAAGNPQDRRKLKKGVEKALWIVLVIALILRFGGLPAV
jgi:hypothetical protein